MFRYQICNCEDEEIFYKQCNAIEKYMPGIEKGRFIEADILIQEYLYENKKIKVVDDDYEVYVESEFDIEPFFKK